MKKADKKLQSFVGFKIRNEFISSMNSSKADLGQENDACLALACIKSLLPMLGRTYNPHLNQQSRTKDYLTASEF